MPVHMITATTVILFKYDETDWNISLYSNTSVMKRQIQSGNMFRLMELYNVATYLEMCCIINTIQFADYRQAVI